MWIQMQTLLSSLAERSRDSNRPWGKLLVPLIIMALYALSTLLKNRPKRPGSTSSRPTPAARGPSYGRQSETRRASGPQPATPATAKPRPVAPARPTVARPTPKQPRPARPSVSGQVQQPRQLRPTPVAQPPRSQIQAKVKAQVGQRRAAGTPARQAVQTAAAGRAKQPPSAAVPAVRRRAAQPQQAVQPHTTRAATSRLQVALNLPNEWARAIVYAEILGRPVGLRSGLYQPSGTESTGR